MVAIAPAVGARLPAIDNHAVCQTRRHRCPRNLGELLQVPRLLSHISVIAEKKQATDVGAHEHRGAAMAVCRID